MPVLIDRSSKDYLAKMAQCEMAARFAPAGVAGIWRSAADCYLLLAIFRRARCARERLTIPRTCCPHPRPDRALRRNLNHPHR